MLRVGFGAEQLGGYQWGSVDIEAVERAVSCTVKRAPTFFDTADCYGRGESERRLGKVLSGCRSQAFVSTKFGVRFGDDGKVYYDNSPDYAERALEASLRRLNTDFVDLFQLHWPDGKTPLADVFDRMERMRDDGRIRFYGVSNVPLSEIAGLPDNWPGFATFSAQYSLAHRGREVEICEICESKGLVFLAWGSLAQGLLSGKYNHKAKFGPEDRRSNAHYKNFHGEKFERNLELVGKLKDMAGRIPGATPAQIAIRFVLEALQDSIAIVGVKNERQLEDNLKSLSLPFNRDDFEILEKASRE